MTKIYSVSGLLNSKDLMERPFRSHIILVQVLPYWWGRIPKPGEVSLAHNGVLFLDDYRIP